MAIHDVGANTLQPTRSSRARGNSGVACVSSAPKTTGNHETLNCYEVTLARATWSRSMAARPKLHPRAPVWPPDQLCHSKQAPEHLLAVCLGLHATQLSRCLDARCTSSRASSIASVRCQGGVGNPELPRTRAREGRRGLCPLQRSPSSVLRPQRRRLAKLATQSERKAGCW